jgi:rhodanese-related sulfurtransferase
MTTFRWIGFVGAAAVAVALGWLGTASPTSLAPLISLRFRSVDWVDAATLADWMMGDRGTEPTLLDVRTAEEFAVSHLPGAIRVDPERPDLRFLELAERSPVVVYCSVGYRSAAILDDIRALGLGEVYNLRGGIFAWANEGHPIVRDQAPASSVHPYDAIWGRLLRPDLRWSP